ncbi:sulfite exporter TauE/SafE family protein [Hahella ganghwensis]|uniref:sulfite exporter TauE/SafE family protein n=1 Tax=Hahella ganghwensis TaxID=286420 RepID=UPI00037C03A5|nr:sulfite exporter TauE/SafE family protein [Hahella ganghwensis]
MEWFSYSDWSAGLGYGQLLLLLLCSFLGSLMTAALGVGGGAFLITIMADIVPPLALIPVHGIVQLGSNASRAILTRKHRNNRVVGLFFVGALVASLASVFLLANINPTWIPVLVAIFILWLSWGPMPQIGLGKTAAGLLSGGFLTTIATMLVGASGPLVSAWLGRSGVDRWVYTANFSSCMTLQHSMKIIAFGFAGFVFTPWIPVMVLMVICGYLGTRVGLKILGKLPEKHFRTVFRWLLTLLALRVLWKWLV